MKTLEQYQEAALRTALPTAFSYQYLVNGIVEEVGELFGQVAKAERDGWDECRLYAELISEYGDISWKVAVLLHWKGTTVVEDRHYDTVDKLTNDDPWSDLLQGAADIFEEWRNHRPARDGDRCIVNAACRLWAYLERHCLEITGEEFSFVLNFNESKLRDRNTRGVLMGSGDHR